jgi:hypothetical protein
VVHHRHRRRARRRIGVAERASEQWLHAEEGEPVGGHPRNRQALGAGLADPVHRLSAGADDVLEGLRLLLVVQEFGRSKVRTADDAPGSVFQHDVDHSIRAGVRKRIEYHVAEHTVDDRDRADSERESQHRDQGEGGCLRKRADAVREVTPQISQPDDTFTLHSLSGHAGEWIPFRRRCQVVLGRSQLRIRFQQANVTRTNLR